MIKQTAKADYEGETLLLTRAAKILSRELLWMHIKRI